MTAQEIKQWRKEHGNMSQAKLAELLPVSLRTLQNWEQGRDKAPDYLERALANVECELKKQQS